MFGLFSSVEKKMRSNAANWLELADKIFHYRRDEMSAGDRADLQQKSEQLRAQLRERADASKLKLGIEALEPALRRAGGTFYPRSTLQEYVEFFVVAAIVILGIRAYFLQPFKIPTNSMWPTYYGMTGEVFHSRDEEPGAAAKLARFALFGATRRTVDAPSDGDVWVPVVGSPQKFTVRGALAPGRTWVVFPATVQQFTMRVGRELVDLKVPADFGFDRVVRDAFFPDATDLTEAVNKRRQIPGQTEIGEIGGGPRGEAVRVLWVNTGKRVARGERVLSFDVMSGDQLFVDRMSYHFVRPKIGSGFVFRTDHIPLIGVEQYYIKRLVGVGGDRLEVHDGVLNRNGRPIEGSPAFEKNHNRVPPYRGYANQWDLDEGRHVTISHGNYYAMGDNSYESSDSRYWGEVPGKNVVGRPLFIYYPFTKRWGPAR